ncbi:sensor histidine kinase [Conexibacter woesei]|uniref:histidine kinase n=1 Tax=Conexibacter woesei (strain DSM 14684 / CCUG 47730 / CIP 108061 / JCM 11494 / NBRC 100937 / ID131577) TaxID=469383 RepID=D3F659_CONWI|nr:HAMP domain-containing sensor histidine kinase [Conexibacter woesei]ADB48732.1 integral membrane sensor signal transduction histidine kinase [Conexibacter woesei DSM 14684]
MRRLRSLRVRLVVAFAAVAVGSALATALLAYRDASRFTLSRTQDAIVRDLRERVRVYAPSLAHPPSQAALERFARDVSPAVRTASVVVTYRDRRALLRPQTAPGAAIPADVRRSVARGDGAVLRRVEGADGEPLLVVGMPVAFAGAASAPSGIAVFAVASLAPERDDAARLARAMAGGIAVAGLIAALLALLAARGVLGPVRRLGAAARELAQGRLDTRLDASGGDELAELSRTFNATAAALEQNVAELRRLEASARRFVADVSHELRTPVSAMLAATEALDGEDAAAAAQLVSNETARLAQLVNDLIEVSRFDARAAVLRVEEVDVGEAVAGTLRVRGWTERVAADLPPGIRAELDPRRLDVIVANLVGNALRHGAPPVRVVLRAGERGVELAVADSGAGIPADERERVFERFYKGDRSRARTDGSGLGLSIATENARLHGGGIVAAAAPGGGACFTVRLPWSGPA